MFIQSCPVCDIITQQLRSRARLIRSEQVRKDPTPKNTSIRYTHDVVSFKEKHLLHLPKDFWPHIIDSETHLLEIQLEGEQYVLAGVCGRLQEWILKVGLQSLKTIHRTGVHRSEQQVGLESRKTVIKLHRSA
jgi:hypothetical protein